MSASKALGSDGLEVVHYDHNAPEVIEHPQAARIEVPVGRRDSQCLPEAALCSEKTANHYSAKEYYAHDASTEQDSNTTLVKGSGPYKRRRRIRWTIIVLVAVISLLLVVGAVVGGVLGSQAARKSSESAMPSSTVSSNTTAKSNTTFATFKAVENTGLALITATNETVNKRYAYQYNTDKTIMEIPYANGKWNLSSATTVYAKPYEGSPLAATSFTLAGITYRTLAFIDSNGQVMVMNRTQYGTWSTPVEVASGDLALTSSPALALCADTQYVNGIRLYYASSNGFMQELASNFSSSPTWTKTQLHNPNANSGIACVIDSGIQRLYWRNNTSVQQYRWNFAAGDTKWKAYPGSMTDYPIDDSSDVAATTDGAGTDYVYYRKRWQTTLVRASFYGSNQAFTGYVNVTDVRSGAKFDAAYIQNGTIDDTLLLSQANDTTEDVYWTASSADGSVQYDGSWHYQLV